MSEDRSLQTRQSSWRTRTVLAGGILGSLIGVGAAYLYVRAAEEATQGGAPKRVKTRDALRIGTAMVAIVRQIAELGGRK